MSLRRAKSTLLSIIAISKLFHPEGIFGELSLIDQETRIASAIERTDCILQAIDKRRILFLVQATPMFAIQVIKVMANRLRRVDLILAKAEFERVSRGEC